MTFPLSLHDSITFTKTISAEEVAAFAQITGNSSPTHTDEALMRRTDFGGLLVPGELLLGLTVTAAFRLAERANPQKGAELPVSLGFERVRFIRPVYFGETVTVQYTIDDIEYPRNRSWAKVEILNTKGEVVCSAAHLLKWLPIDGAQDDN